MSLSSSTLVTLWQMPNMVERCSITLLKPKEPTRFPGPWPCGSMEVETVTTNFPSLFHCIGLVILFQIYLWCKAPVVLRLVLVHSWKMAPSDQERMGFFSRTEVHGIKVETFVDFLGKSCTNSQIFFLPTSEILRRIKHVIRGVTSWGWIFLLKHQLGLLLERYQDRYWRETSMFHLLPNCQSWTRWLSFGCSWR